MVEFYANNANDPGDYLIGEQFDLKATHDGLRRMDDPASDGARRLLVAPRRATPTSTTPRASATTSSTCSRRARGAKTINGVSYNSPTCNGSTVTGIGRDAAARSGTAR